MIYTKDNIVGVKFTTVLDMPYTITGFDADWDVVIEWGGDKREQRATYEISNVLKWLNSGEWKVISQPTTPRQQADDLLSEFVDFVKSRFENGTAATSLQNVEDFLTHKFGE